MTQTLEPPLGPLAAFAYQAQTLEGQPITGTIDAASADQAQRLLAGLRLRVLNVEPAAVRPPRGKPLRAEDFIAFNQQLAHLTSAGMPVEQGLRLIAQDMHSGRLAQTIREVAAELERGTPLEQAFEKHQGRFPPLYSRLIAAGVSSGNLPGLLFNLGRHMDLIQRLRAALWRAAAYPLTVLAAVCGIILFLSLAVIPKFETVFAAFGIRLPPITVWILTLPAILPSVLIALAAAAAAALLAWAVLKGMGRDRAVLERITLAIPLIGPVLRYNLLARWCDAMALAVQAGLDLPRAIDLAADAVTSPALRHDGDELRAALLAGQSMESAAHMRLLPATVVATMTLASQQNDLPAALSTLSEMYQQQARLRLSMLPGLLTPALLILVAGVIGVVIVAMFLPIISLIQNISSPGSFKK